MKRYGNLYSKIITKENLYLAHKNASKGKRKYKEVIEVTENLDHYIDKLHAMLAAEEFVNSEYEIFTKMDKGKERQIYKLPYFPDRIVQHAIMQILEPIWKSVLITDTYQSIKGRGLHKAAKKLSTHIKKHKPRYYLQVDVKKFYPSINNEKLKQIVRKKIKCKQTLNLLDIIIDSTQGIPIGNYLSQYLGNLYLSYVDHKMKEVGKHRQYYRYCDDIIIVSDNKKILEQAKQMLDYELKKLSLKVKHNWKLGIIDVHGLDFLGTRMFHQKLLLRKKIATSMKLATRREVVMSYYGWCKLANGYNLWRVINERSTQWSGTNRGTRTKRKEVS